MVALLQNKDLRAYLARILASFTKVDSTTVVYRARGLTYQRHFSELSFDDVLELAGWWIFLTVMTFTKGLPIFPFS